MKKCSTCKLEKDDVGKSGKCNACNTEYMRQFRAKNKDKIKKYNQEYGKTYYKDNKEEILDQKKEYYQENKENILDSRKEYYQDHKEEIQEYNKSYYQDNKEEILKADKLYRQKNAVKIKNYQNNYNKNRRKHNINFRIKTNVSANIYFYLKSNGLTKNRKSTVKHLPYTLSQLKNHLENQFESWMTWKNYGKYMSKTWNDNDMSTWTWQIDHIIPHSTFKYASMEDDEFKKCWDLSNLRPLSSKQNFLEGVKRIRH